MHFVIYLLKVFSRGSICQRFVVGIIMNTVKPISQLPDICNDSMDSYSISLHIRNAAVSFSSNLCEECQEDDKWCLFFLHQ